jgi:uncharacterized protein YjbI with pentapeptide repeats
MASEQHLTLLQQGFKVWNLWRQRYPKIVPELRGADLTGLKLFKVDLSGADLSEVDFSETSLYQANLSGANLCKANFSTAILQEANLSGASLIEANLKDKKFPKTNLSGSDLSRANLSGAKFYRSTNLNFANFKAANLSNSDLRELNLRNSNFSGANLSEANLSDTNLNSVNFYRANLCKANLNAANLDAVNFCGANLNEANLEYANLRGAQIQEAIIDEKWYLVWDIINNGAEGRVLYGLDLSMADLEGANFAEADLHNTNFTGAKLSRANLARSNLFKANFYEANLGEADLREASLQEANLKYANLRGTQTQEAIIDEKWYLVWDIVNNGAEDRDFSKVDLSEADLRSANLKGSNLSGTNLSKSILVGANLRWADLREANFREANLAESFFDWSDLSEANLLQVKGEGSITCRDTIFYSTKVSARLCNLKSGSADFSEANVDIEEKRIYDLVGWMHDARFGGLLSVQDAKEFFKELNLLSWQNQKEFEESIKKSLSSSKKSFIPGILLYTDEDNDLSLYVRKHFDAFDNLTGDWCKIFLLEAPSSKWRKANQSWRKVIETNLHKNWFNSKPYDKSEAYDIARQLDVEPLSIPCLVLISPTNLSEKLVLPIKEVSPEYFRKLFSTLEKLVKDIISDQLRREEASSQVFDYLRLNFNEIVNFLEKHASKENNNHVKYILKGDNIFVSIEPVNIGTVNYNEKIEGNFVQGDYTDQSRNLNLGGVEGDFKPINSALMADGFSSSSTVAESINLSQGTPEEAEFQNRQDEKSSSETSKGCEPRSISKDVRVIVILLTLLSGLAAYIFFQLTLSKQPVSHPSQEQRIKE